jgi:hypothetical protein
MPVKDHVESREIVVEITEKTQIIPGYRPPEYPDLMRRGEHSHPLQPQFEVA